MKRSIWILCWVGFIVGSIGCESVKVLQQETRTAQPSFMETWRIYNHCTHADNLEALLVDSLLLKHATNRMQQDEILALFSPIQSLVAPSPVRLAADPRAMTASCTMKAAETAMGSGWNDLAVTLYQTIIHDYSGASYVYYREQAMAGLAHVLQHMANLPATPPSSASTSAR